MWLLLFACKAPAFQFTWRDDRALTVELRDRGIVREKERSILFFERDQLSDAQMDEFADIVDQGIVEVAKFVDQPLPNTKISYFVSTQVGISHSRGRSVYLPLSRVRDRSAPYLHETLHVLLPCDACPVWLSEGYASYVQSYLGEHGGGYDGKVFAAHGNVGVDLDAVRWLRDDRGRAMLLFVGTEQDDPELQDRRNSAAPFYELAQSFVKYLVEKQGLRTMPAIVGSPDLPRFRVDWLNYLKALR